MASLDGEWRVQRVSGLLPPLAGVRKRISGRNGETTLGPLRARFEVEGLTLRYCRPFGALVDELEPDDDGFRGRAMFLGRVYGRFELRPASRGGEPPAD
jgi:hypothetical protein